MVTRKLLAVSAILGVFFSIFSVSVCAKEIEDQRITNHLETEFWVDNVIPSNTVYIETNEGVVTLTGITTDILAKDRAQEIASATVGVKAVINKIDVMYKPLKSDSEIKNDVKMALLDDPVTESFEIAVNVKAGVVTLTGEVDSWQEKQLATTVAKDVPGVSEVQNDISVDYKAERSDYEIQQEIEKRLANDVRIDDGLINVKVKDGEVKLSGTVGSLQEKDLAYVDAWVAGVNTVNTENLNIKWWARDEMQRFDKIVNLTDDEIESSVKMAFLYDPRVISFNIKVDVKNGVVTLGGVVDNLHAKNSAKEDARNTVGVLRVKNNIKVKPEVAIKDQKLKDKIAERLAKDKYIERYDIDISVDDGMVYLSGEVDTSWEKNRAENLASRFEGVLYVSNNIDFEHKWQWKPDWEITEDIQSQLEWSPFVDSDEVNIAVNNGLVTLTGTVNSYSERQSAVDNAFEGGAKEVLNKIDVKYKKFGPYYHYSPYTPVYYGYYYGGYGYYSGAYYPMPY